jgi:hypothetical protein
MYLGRYQQGQEIPLTLQCVDANDAPADPLTVPVAKLYLDGATPTLVEAVKLAPDLRGVEVGLFRVPHFLGGLYGATGRYLVTVSYVDANGVGRVSTRSFHLLPGGSPDGSVISMKYVQRPDSRFLIWQTDGGRMVRGRNPR